MKKRIVSLLLGVCLIATMFVGCGSSGSASTDTEQRTESSSSEQGTENNVQSTEDIAQESKAYIFDGIDVRLEMDESKGWVTSGAFGGHDSHLIFQIASGHLYCDTKADGAYSRLYNQSSFATGREWIEWELRSLQNHDSYFKVERCGIAISNDGVTYTEISEGDEIASTDNLTAAQIFKAYNEGASSEAYVIMTYEYIPSTETSSYNWKMTGLYSPYYTYKFFPNHEFANADRYRFIKNLEEMAPAGARYCLFIDNASMILAYTLNDEVVVLDRVGDEILRMPNYEDLVIYYEGNNYLSVSYTLENGETQYYRWTSSWNDWKELDSAPNQAVSFDTAGFWNSLEDALFNPRVLNIFNP